MTQLDTANRSVALHFEPGSDIEEIHRLIVLVPGVETDFTAVANRVCELAAATGARLTFLSLWHDPKEEPGLRRGLITMSAIVRSRHLSAEGEIVFGKDWVEAVTSRYQPGDMIVCLAEQRAGLMNRTLSRILQSNLEAPVYILAGLYDQEGAFSWPARAVAWIGFLAIALGFLLLDVKIYQLRSGWTALWMVLATALEFWLIWVWNKLSG